MAIQPLDVKQLLFLQRRRRILHPNQIDWSFEFLDFYHHMHLLQPVEFAVLWIRIFWYIAASQEIA
jgi:hypothetical protein